MFKAAEAGGIQDMFLDFTSKACPQGGGQRGIGQEQVTMGLESH